MTFWHRTAGGTWSSPVVFNDSTPADHVPEDTAYLYYSMAAITSSSEDRTMTVRIFEFEADAGVD